MTERFKEFIEIILRNEGGYVNNPADPGGETKYGISKKSHPQLDIKNLTIDQAKEIYYKEYYKPFNIELIRNRDLALQVFDFAVNAYSASSKLIQRLVGVTPDGVIGNDTLRAINLYPNQDELHNRFQQARADYYNSRVEKDPGKQVFIKGWLRRVWETTPKKKL